MGPLQQLISLAPKAKRSPAAAAREGKHPCETIHHKATYFTCTLWLWAYRWEGTVVSPAYLPGLVSFSRAASVWDTNRGRPWTCLAVFISCEPRMDKQLSRPHPSYCLYAYSIRYRCIRVYNWQYMPWQWVVWLCSLIRVCLKHSASPEWMDRIVLLRLQGHQLGMAIFLDTYIDEHAVVLAGFLATLSGYPFC